MEVKRLKVLGQVDSSLVFSNWEKRLGIKGHPMKWEVEGADISLEDKGNVNFNDCNSGSDLWVDVGPKATWAKGI